MNKLVKSLMVLGLVSVSGLALAEEASPHTLSFNVGLTTDYIFRGVTQTQHDPAISGGADYSHSSGLYAGTWLSSQKWVDDAGPYKADSNIEWDVYGGYKGTAGDFGYDLGVIHYAYNGERDATTAGLPTPETTEVYVGASWKWLSAKYSYVVSPYFIGWGTRGTVDTKGSDYIELNASYDLGNGWGLLGHLGHQRVENVSAANYTDWKVGVTKDVGFGIVTLAYTDTNADTTVYTWAGEEVADGRVALSFSKSF